MAYKYKQGQFRLRNPKKYKGNPTQIFYRSGLELKVMYWLDRDPSILEWSSEELIIPYISPLDGEVHRYFPDFLVKMETATGVEKYVIEVKPQCQIQVPKPPKNNKPTKKYIQEVRTYVVNQAKWEAARKFCKSRNYKFTTLNEHEIG